MRTINYIKKTMAVTILLGLVFISSTVLAESTLDEKAQCIKGSVNKTELAIQKQLSTFAKYLGKKASTAIEPITEHDNFEFISKTGKVLGKELGRFGYSSKITFYKYIRKHGIKIKLKVPLDFDLTQKLLESIIDTGDAKAKFTAQYVIDIDPDLRTGHIYRDDSLIFTPQLSYSDLIKNFTATGTLNTSYTYTLTRRHLGHKKDDKFDDINEFIKPIRTVLKGRPVFFKDRCNQSRLGYIANLKSNLDIPTSYDKLNDFMMIDDTLTFQKKMIVSTGLSIGKLTSAIKTGASLGNSRHVSLNKIVHKTQQTTNPYPIYHIKTFLDSVDTTFSFDTYANGGAFETTLVGWKQLNKALLKPLRQKLLKLSLGKRKQLTFLNSFFISLDDPKFQAAPGLIQNIKTVYDDFLENYFLPKWVNIKDTNSILYSLNKDDNRKEHLKAVLLDIIKPIQDASIEAKEVIDRLGIPVENINDPTCNHLKLYPLTNYFSGTKDLKESFMSFMIAVPKIAGFRYSQRGKDNFYEFKDDFGNPQYFSQAVLNLQAKTNFLFTKQTTHKQTYLLAEAGQNESILEFKTLGFNFELNDTNYYFWNKRNFRNEIEKIIPVGRLKDDIEKELTFIEPYIKNDSAYLGYKYLFTQPGFQHLQDVVTREAKNDNYNYIYNLLKKCMNRNDKNYQNKIPCISHLPQFQGYIRYMRNGAGYFDETKMPAGSSIHHNYPEVNKVIKTIATKLTFILLANENYYQHVDKMGNQTKRMFYKSKSFKLTKKKRFATVNNAKYAIFKSLAGVKLFDFTVRSIQGEEVIFENVAPVFLTYLLFYSMDGSDHESMYINDSKINEYLYFYAQFRSPEDNIERHVRQKVWSVKDMKEVNKKLDKSTKKIIQKVNFFEFNFNNVLNNQLMCDVKNDDDDQSERVRFVD